MQTVRWRQQQQLRLFPKALVAKASQRVANVVHDGGREENAGRLV